jgi:hypothetical protein
MLNTIRTTHLKWDNCKEEVGRVVPMTKEEGKGNVFDETWCLRCVYETGKADSKKRNG